MDKLFKIAIINTSDRGGGAEEFVRLLHNNLLKLGHHSTLYVAYKKTQENNILEIPYVRGFPGLRRFFRKIENITGLQDIYNPSFRNLINLIPSNTDVIHFNNLWGASGYADISALPALTNCFPGILTEHQNWFFTGHCAYFFDCLNWQRGCGNCPDLTIPPAISRDGTKFNWRRKQRIVSRSNICFVGVSDSVCTIAKKSPIWQSKSIFKIFNGIDQNTFKKVSVDYKIFLRKKLGIPQNKIAVLFTGKSINSFHQGPAIDGFQAINHLSDFSVIPVLVGKIKNNELSFIKGNSVLIPHRETPEEMAECYQASDITMVTSNVETFGRVAAESQACGTPVVSYDTGGLTEVVKDVVGGFSVKKGNVYGLIQALKELAQNSVLRNRLGENGINYVSANFESSYITNQYLKLYQKILLK